MSDQMNAIEITGPGGPEVLGAASRPIPKPGVNEVLIRVRAAGVNGHDLHQRHRGHHPIAPGETDLPGLEVSGEIERIGDGVEEFVAGDKVCALLRGGGYAEYVVAPVGQVLPIPAGLNWTQAAALPEACFTVWSNVYVEAALQPGESFLMNGGTSGIGVTATQIVSSLGNRVFATAGGAKKCDFVKSLGAHRVIDYHTEDFEKVIEAETEGAGVDVILEIVCGDYLQKDLNVLGNYGRLTIIGAAKGVNEQLDLRAMVVKQLTLRGTLLRPKSLDYKKDIKDALLKKVWPLVEEGRIKAVVDSVFALNDASAAHQKMEDRKHIGKVVLEVS
ncbi:MAG: NAD(P)H-quinone oxidoreductase [Pseudomonadota bacterium]